LKKVCYKVSLCEYCQQRSCKAFNGLSIGAKMVHGGCRLPRENWPKVTTFLKNADFQSTFVRSA